LNITKNGKSGFSTAGSRDRPFRNEAIPGCPAARPPPAPKGHWAIRHVAGLGQILLRSAATLSLNPPTDLTAVALRSAIPLSREKGLQRLVTASRVRSTPTRSVPLLGASGGAADCGNVRGVDLAAKASTWNLDGIGFGCDVCDDPPKGTKQDPFKTCEVCAYRRASSRQACSVMQKETSNPSRVANVMLRQESVAASSRHCASVKT